MKIPIKASFLTVLALLTVFGAESASAKQYGYHHGYHKYHVWRNEHWAWEYHPANWVIPTNLIGPAQVNINLGWGSRPGWQQYRVYRNHRWDHVYHPAGWQVPGAWRGPHGGGRHHHG